MSVRGVHHLNCGTMCPVAGFLLGGDAWRGRWVDHVLLLETERDGLVLVDTGFGTRDVERKSGIHRAAMMFGGLVLSQSETAIEQVKALGFSPTDVKHIVITHLDFDHAGGISDFPHAKVHVHAREHTAAMAPTLRERFRYLAAQWAHGPKWEVYMEDGDTWRGLPAITRLRGLDTDIGLLPMHGHTRGHSAVITKAGDRWIVHAGDAYFHRNALEGSARVPPGTALVERANAVSRAQHRTSLGALRQLCATYRDIDMFCAHDEREYAALRGSI